MLDIQSTTGLRVLTPDEHVSPTDIISDDDQGILSGVSVAMSDCYWLMGDIAAKYIDIAAQQGFRVKKLDNRDVYVTDYHVFEAVGYFAGKRSARTIRYYYETARFYPKEVRDEFDMLDFGTFVVARSFREQWREVLEYAAVNPQLGAEQIREVFISANAGTPPDSTESDAAQGDETASARAEAGGVLALFSKLVDAAHQAVSRLPLPEELRRRGMYLVGELREWISESTEELKHQGEQ